MKRGRITREASVQGSARAVSMELGAIWAPTLVNGAPSALASTTAPVATRVAARSLVLM
jgi:hypothetical protein